MGSCARPGVGIRSFASPSGGLIPRLAFLARPNVLSIPGERIRSASNSRPRHPQKGIASRVHFYAVALTSGNVLDASRQGSVARFANHSCDPNLDSEEVIDPKKQLHIVMFARRDIAVGEELTVGEAFPPFPLTLCGRLVSCKPEQRL